MIGRVIPQKIIDAMAHASSSRRFLLLITVLTAGWLVVNRLLPNPFDDWRTGYPLLVLGFTVYFGLVEGVMKVVQAEQTQREEVRATAIATQTFQIFELSQELREYAKRAEKGQADMIALATGFQKIANKILDKIEVPKTNGGSNGK